MSAVSFAVTMGMDAMRLCLGIRPRNHSAADVIRWIKLMEPQSLTAVAGGEN
jgi:hypothetical protein